MRLPHKRQTAGRSVVACDSNSARTLGQVFPSQQVMLNEQRQQGNAARWGRDAFGTATRISASLFRRLSAFFGSTPDQAPKAAQFAVLPPGHAGFPKRVKRSEGRDTTPHPKRPAFRPVSRCVRSCWQRRVCTHFHPQKRMWAVLQAIATRAFLPCGTH